MAYADALTDVVTINSIAYNTDSEGQETKVPTPLYVNIPGRLMSRRENQQNRTDEGAFEATVLDWLIHLEPTRTGITKGMEAVVNGTSYLITKVHEIKGTTSDIHHIIIYVQEKV
jgi:hypothetical protein